jgi:hypothetical protein
MPTRKTASASSRSRRTGQASRGKKWTPERILAMRKELLRGKATLQQVADREGVSRQRISSLVGPLKRRKRRVPVGLIRDLALEGKNNRQITDALGLSRDTVRYHRGKLGIPAQSGPPLRWPPERIIKVAQTWYKHFGSLNSTDWNPGYLKRKGDHKRLARYNKYRPPHSRRVMKRFGSWPKMMQAAGLPTGGKQSAP